MTTCVDQQAQTQTVLNNIQDSVAKTSAVVDSLLQKLQEDQIDTAHGLSFLEVKNHTLLSYLINLNRLIVCKLHGQSLQNEPAVDHLIEDRTYLERMRPIEQKLRYQIDKYIRISATGQKPSNDPLSFKARPDDLVEDNENSDKDGEGEVSGKRVGAKSGVYVPPKMAAVHYDGDESAESRRERRMAAAKRRALNSSVMHELGGEYLDTPEELHETSGIYKHRATRQEIERREYEEENMVRLPETRKERRKRMEIMTDWSLGADLTRQTDLSALDGREISKGRKRKGGLNSKKGHLPKQRGNKRPKFNL